MTTAPGSRLPLALADSLLPSLLVEIPKRRGNDDCSLPTDFQHPGHSHARMHRTRRKVPLCPEESLTTQVHVDQVDAKGNDLLYSTERIPSTTPGAEPPRDVRDSGQLGHIQRT